MHESSKPTVPVSTASPTTKTTKSFSMRRYLPYGALAVLLALALLALNLYAFSGSIEQRLSAHYYLALGDSLSFGFQPDLNFSKGFADDMANDLRTFGVADDINYACPGETTLTMIDGGCPLRLFHRDAYTGPQMDAAVAFLNKYRGRVGPITLEIGSNNVLPDFDPNACTVNQNANADLARMDQNLTQVILPRMLNALSISPGLPVPVLNMLNYYDPYARQCPESLAFVRTLNAHLAADALPFGVPMIDVFGAFGGDAHMADNVCSYTWYCNAEYHFDIHPTSQGYRVIANTIEQTLGYRLAADHIAPATQVATTRQAPGAWEMADLPTRERLA